MVSSTYLRLLIFLLAILSPAYALSSLAFHMMYCAYKLKISSSKLDLAIWIVLNSCMLCNSEISMQDKLVHQGLSLKLK